MVLLLAGGVQRKEEKQPRNFHLNVTVPQNLLVRRYTDAIKLTTVDCFCFKCISFWKTQFCRYQNYYLSNSFYLTENIFIVFTI